MKKAWNKGIKRKYNNALHEWRKNGGVVWNKGLHYKAKPASEEKKLKISLSQKGRHNSRKTEFKSGKKHPRYGKPAWNKGIKYSEETKRKISLTHGGTGIPYENTEYGAEFDSSLRESIRFRDNYKCMICGCSQLECGRQLDVHHIDYNKKNNSVLNLISLCQKCHTKTNFNRLDWTKTLTRASNGGRISAWTVS